MVVLLILAIMIVVFLIRGLDTVDIVRQSVTRNHSTAINASNGWTVLHDSLHERACPERRARTGYPNGSIDAESDVHPELQSFGGDRIACHSGCTSPSIHPGPSIADRAHSTRLDGAAAGVGTGICLSEGPGRRGNGTGVPTSRYAQTSTFVDESIAGALANERGELKTDGCGKTSCWGVGQSVKRWAMRLPLSLIHI